ncbi:MAG: C-type lectin domain-containing protein [Ruminococcaceae bacterium]|nr:C-type lectin domain-containing protein [Oscillospiraceae bacterium]
MKNIRSRILCVLLVAAMLVSAIAGIANSVFPTASAATFFTPSKGSFYEAKGTTMEQGQEVWKLLAAQTQKGIADKMYDIIFRAQYCVTDFGGDYWCNPNTAGQIKSVTDAVLGTVNWGWGGSGCFSYSMFVSQYARGSIGRNNIYKLSTTNSGTDLKNFLAAYADPGEHLHFYYSGSSYGEHSVVYLAGTQEGFYYLSENGNSLDIRLYYSSYSYFASILRMSGSESIRVYSTNVGKDTPTDPDSVVIPFTPAKIAQIMFNGHSYTFYKGADSYAKAAEYAAEMGGYLATVTSAEEQAVVNSLMAGAELPFAWIGLNAKDGDYAWVTGEKLLYRNDYDDNTTGPNGFLFTDKLSSGTLNGKWDTCGSNYTIAGKTYNSDSFGFIVETGAAFPTPVVKVSEVLVGLDQYTVFDAGLNYKEAQEFCESIGGHLVTIGTADELATILNLQKSVNTDYMLGATMQANGKWAWLDNTPVMTDVTLPGASKGEHLVIATSADGSPNWSITNDRALTGFICEINLSEFYIGDVDMDGKISAGDAREVLRFSVGLSDNINVEMLGNVDMTDMSVSAGDARMLLRASVGLEDWQKWEKVLINLNDSLI